MQKTPRKILVTSALLYANGDIHLGHLVETIQTDIWARFQRLRGNQCFYVCGSDAHGTPIMLSAEKREISPEQLIAEMYTRHQADFANFFIHFDGYQSTHTPENQALVETVYNRLKKQGDIVARSIQQAYDPVKNMFLPDRFVKGECPRCGAHDQYGDNCEACGATYTPLELKNPISVLSGIPPIQKTSEHYFFQLSNYTEFLREWTHSANHLQSSIANKLDEWFEVGLQPWDISRDAPYFGFEIPEAPGKYFYVWFDAPVGYIGASNSLGNFWDPETASGSLEKSTEVYHFVGKDVVYFHALFWPAMLKGAGFRTPTSVFTHGFLTIDGQKMSKSRGTFITARHYAQHLDPEYLRYYFAAKLNNRVEDLDLNFDDFMHRVNADLIGKVINIASRCAAFINRYFYHRLASSMGNTGLFEAFLQARKSIADCYENREYSRAMREIMELADKANQYINDKQPWALIKTDGHEATVHEICTLALNLFRQLIIYLKPVLPRTAQNVEAFLQIPSLTWDDLHEPLFDHVIAPFKPLLQRVEQEKMIAMKNENVMTQNENVQNPNRGDACVAPAVTIPNIKFEDFAKIDLRVGRIVTAEQVPDADKLLKLMIDIGEEKPRQIFAGIKSAYNPEDLEGKLTVIVANLEPRKMRFGLSEGMVIVASDETKGLFILEPQTGAQPGMRVK
ncbi:MAG: methionine--tRNA ligase [Gammaproteobacteria bacterium]